MSSIFLETQFIKTTVQTNLFCPLAWEVWRLTQGPTSRCIALQWEPTNNWAVIQCCAAWLQPDCPIFLWPDKEYFETQRRKGSSDIKFLTTWWNERPNICHLPMQRIQWKENVWSFLFDVLLLKVCINTTLPGHSGNWWVCRRESYYIL